MKKYWHIQLHSNDSNNWPYQNIAKIIREKQVIGIGESWENDQGQPQAFKKI